MPQELDTRRSFTITFDARKLTPFPRERRLEGGDPISDSIRRLLGSSRHLDCMVGTHGVDAWSADEGKHQRWYAPLPPEIVSALADYDAGRPMQMMFPVEIHFWPVP